MHNIHIIKKGSILPFCMYAQNIESPNTYYEQISCVDHGRSWSILSPGGDDAVSGTAVWSPVTALTCAAFVIVEIVVDE
jgi:hypothetical protein